MSDTPVLALLGASSACGRYFLERSARHNVRIIAVSRRQPRRAWPHALWMQHDLTHGPVDVRAASLVSFAPLRFTLEQVQRGSGLGRVVATSPAEARFEPGCTQPALEQQLRAICRQRGIVLTLLKPMSLHEGADCPPAGEAWPPQGNKILVGGNGLRAPVHADDVAALALECLARGSKSAGSWLLGGGESLTLQNMLRRLAAAGGHEVKIRQRPGWLLNALSRLGHSRAPNSRQIERHKTDRVVDDTPARERLGWSPRPFRP